MAKDHGTKSLEELCEKIKDMTAEEYDGLLERAKQTHGPNGEPSYYEKVERGYFDCLQESHGIFLDAVYVHYKGQEYRVESIAMDCESLELVVQYEALYDNTLYPRWTRPLSDFTAILPNGTPRFKLKNPDGVKAAISGEAIDDAPPRNKMIYLDNSKTAFRCECGCNVFQSYAPFKYRCNGCHATYTGEKE